ncbi:hypothetical protein ASD68_09340 [Rhodanobacter sp. Root627]|uniref:hypothetical protein n=1 Tax=Rhodanobacter sp. Root627 TaxID=1736572 RepID=UPI0006F1D9F1|nr:hypothetical protein [Rhodanobacter sp. Root627]KRA33227.1 hypothetical protein ASD68_09340 [Rhodanobacter sp. Root627]
MRLLPVVAVVLIGWGGLHHWRHRDVIQPPGVLAPDAPHQVNLTDGASLQRDGMALATRAYIDLTARVLSREDYTWDAGAKLAPTDLALGWGRMSDSAVLASFDISQSGRFFYWRTKTWPIPRNEVELSTANVHMIPADAGVRGALKRVRKGQLVHIEGFLVDASGPNGWRWKTSMTRGDTGAGACELVYVESVQVVD